MKQKLYAEDLVHGAVLDLGEYTVTRDEMLAFARQWDPQDFHIDQHAASQGFFGELIASGIHSLAIFQKLSVLGLFDRLNVIAGRVVKDVRFARPVKAGAVLHGSVVVAEIRLVRPDRALVVTDGTLTAGGETVMTMTAESYVRRRPTPNQA